MEPEYQNKIDLYQKAPRALLQYNMWDGCNKEIESITLPMQPFWPADFIGIKTVRMIDYIYCVGTIMAG